MIRLDGRMVYVEGLASDWLAIEAGGAGDTIVIIDLDRGGRSVTNDIEAVLATLDDQLGGLGDRPVIYRDSEGLWDGVLHSGAVFRGFRPLRERSVGRALQRVRPAP